METHNLFPSRLREGLGLGPYLLAPRYVAPTPDSSRKREGGR